ncbi:LacI family DNA-binding transcriptional regulator [Schaalia hyovaginalis]|uniref:LacI family DNA-binding transcriptional regulator n=1 Tax=Schaalia hyovaginalis TaxID=29316 RepID=UPI0018A6CBF2|nr:LacI family DNA-binding transcriptional regulator [Schaalia hyovaginalis]
MATISDVAARAGVSISTVSYVLSGKRSISSATAARVEKAIEELGYRPNAGAQMLASASTKIIAFSAPMHSETYPMSFMAFVLSVVGAARAHGYDVILLTESGEDAVEGIRRVVGTDLVDGIVMMDVALDDPRVDVIRSLDIPAVVIGLPKDSRDLACVDLDFGAAARLCVDSLAEKGHRALALIGHPTALYERDMGFAWRFRRAFLDRAAELGLDAVFVPTDGEDPLVGALGELPGLSALVLDCNEYQVEAVLSSARSRGLLAADARPEGLSVLVACASFDTDRFAIPLDVVPLDATQSGTRAVDMLLSLMRGSAPRVELYSPEYRERGSVRRAWPALKRGAPDQG